MPVFVDESPVKQRRVMYISKGNLEDDDYEIVFQAPIDKVHRIVKK